MSPPSTVTRVRTVLGRWGIGMAGHLPPGVRRAINTARGIDTPRLVAAVDGSVPLVLAPHPDDELIGAGGVMVHHIASGVTPQVVHVTSGERTAGLAHLAADDRGPHREREAITAATAIGLDADHVTFLRLPDGGVDANDDSQVASLVRVLVEHQPDLVYAPWPIDAHRDHTETTALLARAAASVPGLTTIALYEVWSPLPPTHVVDITDAVDAKIDALGAYESALVSVDYQHTARGLAAYRSAQCMRGEGYAEAFAVMSPAALAELINQIQG